MRNVDAEVLMSGVHHLSCVACTLCCLQFEASLVDGALAFLKQILVGARYQSSTSFYLTSVALCPKDAPNELMVHSTEGWLVEEGSYIGVAIVIVDLLSSGLLSPDLAHGCWT